MNPDPQNFEPLRRMLALKKHEQPPPGYFEDFSSQVIARIRAGDQGQPLSAIERLLEEVPWLRRFWDSLQAKPVFAGAFGTAVCALLVSGVVYSESVGSRPLQPGLMANEPTSTFASVAPQSPEHSIGGLEMAFSTNPIAPLPSSLFEQAEFRIQPEAATFVLPNAGN